MTRDEFVGELIAIGQTEQFDDLSRLIKHAPQYQSGEMTRRPSGYWIQLAEHRSADDLANLIKVLTVAERDVPGFSRGSVSPVIWIFRQLQERHPGDYSWLEDWVLNHTDITYLPWGSSNHGARSVDEYRRLCGLIAERKRQREQEEANRKEDARTRRAAKATHDLLGAVRRRDVSAIVALRRKGAKVDAPGPDGKSARQLAELSGDARVSRAVLCGLCENEGTPN